MMTNVLLGDYPDVFKAGAAFIGVPFGCFATTDGSSGTATCANGQSSRPRSSGATWSAPRTPATPAPRPRMQVWHGTDDDTLRYPNFGEEIKQWTNVLGREPDPGAHRHARSPAGPAPATAAPATQAPVEAISIAGRRAHLPLSGMAARRLRFFGLDGTRRRHRPRPPTTPRPDHRAADHPAGRRRLPGRRTRSTPGTPA